MRLIGLKRRGPARRLDSEWEDFDRQSSDADGADDEDDRFHEGSRKRLNAGKELGMMKAGGESKSPPPPPPNSSLPKKVIAVMNALKNKDHQGGPQ